MKISAIIPAYNSQDFILDAIQSIQKQTHPVDEIIIIDDGSTDDTQQIIRSHAQGVSYFQQKNQGPSAARNAGITMAKGDWVAFLDADDQWIDDKIARQLAVLSHSPELHLIAGDMQEIGLKNELITPSVLAKHNLLEKFKTNQSLPIQNALAELVTKNFIPTGTVLAKRTTLIESGMFNPAIHFGEDLELWAKIASQHPITCIPKILMLRRLHENNATSSTVLMLEDLVAVMQSIRIYAKSTLQNQNISANRLVANAWDNLAYWHFTHEDFKLASFAYWNSLKEHLSIRSLIYLVISTLPTSLIKAMRKIKQHFSKNFL